MAEAAQLWLAIEYTGYIPEPASWPAASRDCGMDGWTGSLGITQPRTHRIGYLGVEQDLRERREHVGSREQLGEVEVEPSSEWVQSSLIQYTWRGLYETGYSEEALHKRTILNLLSTGRA